MDDNFRNQVFNTLKQKETDELVEIWQGNNHAEWSDVAFDVIQEILQTRLGELPSQGLPSYEYTEEASEESDSETEEDEGLPAKAETTESMEDDDLEGKDIICPNCQSNNVFIRDIEIDNSVKRVFLKKPEIDFKQFSGSNDQNEVIGIACEDCGVVFFMLKGYL